MCGFEHCGTDKNKENKTWGIYQNISSSCKLCKKQCDVEESFECAGVECDYSDGRYCIWLKKSNCLQKEKRPYSEDYKTCIKIEHSREKGIN